MIERRKTPRKNWVVGKDETGHSILEWKVDYRSAKRQDADPLAKTFDLLQRLEVPDLALVEDERKPPRTGRNPYDTGTFRVKPARRR
jgi:hypothetical protein